MGGRRRRGNTPRPEFNDEDRRRRTGDQEDVGRTRRADPVLRRARPVEPDKPVDVDIPHLRPKDSAEPERPESTEDPRSEHPEGVDIPHLRPGAPVQVEVPNLRPRGEDSDP